jgi:NADH-quinone oxidoreductase subunit N
MAALKKDSTFSVDAGLKYFILGAFSSSLFLFGSSILYGVSGTTNFEDLKNLFFLMYLEYESIYGVDTYTFVKHVFIDGGLIQFALVFIFVSLLFKLAVAPFHLWSLDVYEGSPSSSTFFFAVVPKLAIFILIIRIFYSSFFEYSVK